MAGRGPYRGLGIDWTFPDHVGQINNRGEELIHEVGMRCTCSVEDSHAGQVERTHVPRKRTTFRCGNCGGTGHIYRNPQKIVALITEVSESMSRQEAGWLVPGDCVMSPKPGYTVSAGDLITFTWSQPVADGQVIVRGAGNLSDNSGRKTNLEINEDLLLYNGDSAIWCEDEDGNVYRGGADFELDGSKIIRWVGNAPINNKKYVIKYNAFFEWVVFMPPSVRMDANRDLGARVGLKKRHVAAPNEDPTTSARDRVPFCDRLVVCA